MRTYYLCWWLLRFVLAKETLHFIIHLFGTSVHFQEILIQSYTTASLVACRLNRRGFCGSIGSRNVPRFPAFYQERLRSLSLSAAASEAGSMFFFVVDGFVDENLFMSHIRRIIGITFSLFTPMYLESNVNTLLSWNDSCCKSGCFLWIERNQLILVEAAHENAQET
jgi:hypothetical protein